MTLVVYRILINLIVLFSPIIILIRLLKGKEDLNRFSEKLGFFSKKKVGKKLIWFHGASVGELLSVIPLIENLEKDKNIDQILLTSSTISSAKVFSKFKFKKTIHQFFPIDSNIISKKFINFWKPSISIFIDSEVWPNIILNLNKEKTPIILLNARITKKSFKRWKILKNFADKIFQCFSNTYPCNKETQDFLKFFGVKNINLINNLKFTQKKITNNKIPYKLGKFFKNRDFWCASSTHNGEEEICINSHQELKKNYKNFVSIIIPRHVDRKEEIIDILKINNLKFYCHSSNKPIPNDTEVYLVDTYGETEVFYNLNKVVFMGGSMIKHGGQNPLEAVRHGCKIIHGPNVENFRDIYKLLNEKNISKKIKSKKSLIKQVKQCLKSGKRSNLIVKKIDDIGIDILKAITKELKIIIK